LGVKLGLAPDRCLLVFGGSGFMKRGLQKRLERELKRPVRLLRSECRYEEETMLSNYNLLSKETLENYEFDFNLSEDMASIPLSARGLE
jgi:hypothetical protein